MNNNDLMRTSERTIEEHRDFYLEALESERKVKISSLIGSYKRMAPILHKGLNQPNLDVSVLKYVLDRLPGCIHKTKMVFMVQSKEQIKDFRISPESWRRVKARSRRRMMYFSPTTQSLVCFITSSSDIDDLVNTLIAYQIEWSKLAQLLKGKVQEFIAKEDPSWLGLSQEEWGKIKNSLGNDWQEKILSAQEERDRSLFLFKPTWIGYRQIAQNWWQRVEQHLVLIDDQSAPIYFVSSNLHSLVNTISGYVAQNQNKIFNHIESNYPRLRAEWQRIKSEGNILRVNDFLYYLSKIYFQDFPEQLRDKIDFEAGLGIRTFEADGRLLCGFQVIPVSAIARSTLLDPHLKISNLERLKESKAVIININYPLGFAAYFLLSEIFENLGRIKGVYIIGKAAILAGEIGDIQIPKVVFDENTGNFYFLKNSFNEQPPIEGFQSAVLRNQKSVSVYGTFLENEKQLENYIRAGFNIIEMESGPYLTAVAESQTRKQFPARTSLHFDNLPFDLGVVNYASDNPLSEKTLGTGSLALKGIEATYLASLTTVQRIINLEEGTD